MRHLPLFIVGAVFVVGLALILNFAKDSMPAVSFSSTPAVAVCTSDDWNNNSTACNTPGHLTVSQLHDSYLVLHMHGNSESAAVVHVYDRGTDGTSGGTSFVTAGRALSAGDGDWGWKYSDVLKPTEFLSNNGSYVPGHQYEVEVDYGSAFNPGKIIGSAQFTLDK